MDFEPFGLNCPLDKVLVEFHMLLNKCGSSFLNLVIKDMINILFKLIDTYICYVKNLN